MRHGKSGALPKLRQRLNGHKFECFAGLLARYLPLHPGMLSFLEGHQVLPGLVVVLSSEGCFTHQAKESRLVLRLLFRLPSRSLNIVHFLACPSPLTGLTGLAGQYRVGAKSAALTGLRFFCFRDISKTSLLAEPLPCLRLTFGK